jgi:gliding motility-associated-like protein
MKIYFRLLLLLIIGFNKTQAQCGSFISAFPYTESFESAPAWTAGGTASDWAWGTPAHPLINSAGSGSKCWCVGGLIGSFYNYNQLSSLSSPCFNFTNLTYPWISFKLFWEGEWKYDGMVLQYSLNGGSTWANVGAYGDANNCLNSNWFNYNNITWLTSATTKHGWSGRVGATAGSCQGGNGSGGWVTAKHCIANLAGQPSVKFRFLFGAGTSCNSYDGMAIDDIYIGNAAPNSVSANFTCTNANTLHFFSTANLCPTGYAWNFGDGASGAANTSTLTNPSHTFSSAGNYTVTLTVSGPCNAPATVSIPVTIVGYVLTSQNVSCNGLADGNAAISFTGTPNNTYMWSAGGQTTQTISGLSAGNYSVTVSNLNGCPLTNTFNITQPAAFQVNVNDVSICSGQQANFSASGANSYTWSNGATATSVNTVITQPSATETYTVTGFVGICTNTTTATVYVTPQPILTVNSPTICSGSTASINAAGANVYVWSAGVVAGANPGEASMLVNSTSTFSVTGSNGNCSASGTFTVTAVPVPIVTVTNASICAGQSANLQALGASNYLWSNAATTSSINVSPAASITYTVIGSIVNCLSLPIISSVFVTPNNLVTSNNATICMGFSANLIALGGNNYVWSNGTSAATISVSPIANTSYTVSATDNCGNIQNAISSVLVNPLPIIKFFVDDSLGCNPLCVQFTSQANGSVSNTWQWNFGDNQFSSFQNPTHCYQNQGLYTVKLVVTDVNQCSDSLQKNNYIQVTASPVAAFDATPTITTIDNPIVVFQDQSSNVDTWQWNFDDGNTSIQNNPTNIYTAMGDYLVTLIVSNNAGCSDTTQKTIQITDEFTFYAPNAFSPNGDAHNELFMPSGKGWSRDGFELLIFNRWGEEIFASSDLKKAWDGKDANQNFVVQGVYIWKVKLQDTTGKTHTYKGAVTLIQ